VLQVTSREGLGWVVACEVALEVPHSTFPLPCVSTIFLGEFSDWPQAPHFGTSGVPFQTLHDQTRDELASSAPRYMMPLYILGGSRGCCMMTLVLYTMDGCDLEHQVATV
jgi:hypothetical protein